MPRDTRSDAAPRVDADTLDRAELELGARETALLEALGDAAVETEEVLAFAEDVRARLRAHRDRESPEISAALARLGALVPPVADRESYSHRLENLRFEALRAREILADAVTAELASLHASIDAALGEVRAARDVMLRGRLRRPTPEATVVEPPTQLERTAVHEALPAATPTRPEARPAPKVRRPDDVPSPAALRQNLRRKLETSVGFHSDSNFYSGFSSNLSDGGLFIATELELPVGAELEVSFTLPGGEEIDATCVVRWRRPAQPDLPAGLGVEFVSLPALARDAVHRFMRRRDPIFHEV